MSITKTATLNRGYDHIKLERPVETASMKMEMLSFFARARKGVRCK